MAYFAFAILHPSDQALSRSCASQVRFLGKTQDVSANQKSLEGELRFKRGANVLELCGTRCNSRYFFCDAAYACASCYRVQCYAPNFQRAGRGRLLGPSGCVPAPARKLERIGSDQIVGPAIAIIDQIKFTKLVLV